MKKNNTALGKPLTDHLMVKDHFEGFLMINKNAQTRKKLSIGFIQEINVNVMKSTGGIVSTISGNFDSPKGDLRLAQVYVDKKYSIKVFPSMPNKWKDASFINLHTKGAFLVSAERME